MELQPFAGKLTAKHRASQRSLCLLRHFAYLRGKFFSVKHPIKQVSVHKTLHLPLNK